MLPQATRMRASPSVSGAARPYSAAVRWLLRARHVLFSFLVLFLVWEISVRLLRVPMYLLPPPSKIVADFLVRWPRMAQHTLITTQEILAGYFAAVAVSIPLALTIAHSRLMERSVYPVIVFFQIVPKIAIAPLFIIWFGFGFMPKLLLVFLLSFFPIVVSSIAGFKSIDPEIMDFARSTGAGNLLLFVKIRLPHALPHIFTGLKVGAAFSATAAVVAEFVASDRGLGYLLLQYNGDLNTPMVFATIVLLSAIGLAIYYAVAVIERLTIPWHVSQSGAEGALDTI
jgi:NitT/TauT family transport system permease protein